MKKHIITIILSSLFLSSFTHAFSSLEQLQAAQKVVIKLANDGKTRELLDILEKHHGDTYYKCQSKVENQLKHNNAVASRPKTWTFKPAADRTLDAF